MTDIPQHSALHINPEIDFLLRRAEQESIAAIRSSDARVSQRHDAMATAYSVQAATLLGHGGGNSVTPNDQD